MHFTSPVALSGRIRPSPGSGSNEPRTKVPRKGSKGSSKGSGKSGGKSRGRGGDPSLLATTPDGRQICFNYNSSNGCKDSSCARVHICRKKGCMGDHPLTQCTK